MTTFDENQVRRTISIMKPNNECFEVRVKYKTGSVYSGYFDNADDLVEELKKLPNEDNNVYITLNKLNSTCMSRSQSKKFLKKTDATTSDNDVEDYEWLMVDLDPERPKDTASSNEEFNLAKNLGGEIYKFLKDLGFEQPMMAMSGNGFHLQYKISLKKENKPLIEKCLKVLDMLFSFSKVKVDTSVFNPSRITKLYGTIAMKGTSTEDRPHRKSYIYEDSNITEYKITEKIYLEKLAKLYPEEIEKPQKYNNYQPRDFNIEDWMAKYNIMYRISSYNGGDKYILDCCPFDSSHKGKDACIFKSRNGALGFKCLHNSCADKTWKDIRMMFEPDAYEKKQFEFEQRAYKSFNRNKVKEVKPLEGTKDGPVFFTAEQILARKKESEVFIKTGIKDIDRKMRGLKKGFISEWSGLRGSSKSTILSQIILKAVDDGNNVGCYSGELSAENFMKWMYLQAAGKGYVKPSKYEGYYMVPDDTKTKIAKWLGDRFYLYNNEKGNNSKAILDFLEKFIQDKKLDLVVIDNLMIMNLSSLDENKWDAQKTFVQELHTIAQKHNVHICLVCHPRKAQGFLRLDDVSGNADITNLTEDAFIVHRVNNDFKRLSKQMFNWKDENEIYKATNVVEIAKDRDGGIQDLFVPLYYEIETKRLKNEVAENVVYGWNTDSIELKNRKISRAN